MQQDKMRATGCSHLMSLTRYSQRPASNVGSMFHTWVILPCRQGKAAFEADLPEADLEEHSSGEDEHKDGDSSSSKSWLEDDGVAGAEQLTGQGL